MIRELLEGDDPRPVTLLRAALRRPSCWPCEVRLAERARALGAAPDRPEVGRTLAVSVGPRVLWDVAPAMAGAVPLLGEAARAAWRAPRVTASALPLVRRLRALRSQVGLGLAPVWAEEPAPVALDGGSLGLALCLAHASRLLDRPVPAAVVGCAAVDDRGRLDVVEALPDKLDWIWQNALGVQTVLVAEAQADVVVPGLRVVGASTLKEALRVAFPDVDQQFAASVREDPALAAEVARELRRMVTGGRQQLASWGFVAETAAILLAECRDPDVRREAELARSIASRHEGRVAVLANPLTEGAATMERSARLRWLAQWVQSCADAEHDEPAREAVAEARGHVAEAGERTDADAILLGAMGRALAAIGEASAAVAPLEQAVQLWWALESEAESTYALSELVRVAGVLGDVALVERGDQWRAEVAARPEADPVSVLFVTASAIRAWVQVGHVERAQELVEGLDADTAELAPRHLRESMLRWRARLLDGRGRHAEADTVRASMVEGIYASLAALDRVRRDAVDPAEALARLQADPGKGHEVRRLLKRLPEGVDPAGWVAERFRY